MNTKTKSASPVLFPLAVSIMLMLILAVSKLIIFNLTSAIFISNVDRIVLNFVFYFTSLLCFFWFLLLCFEGFRLNMGRLYRPFKWLLFYIFYPLSLLLILFPRIRKKDLQESFLSFQNSLFLLNIKHERHSGLLILLPHCMQFHDCKIRITRDINDCIACGSCDICGLKKLGQSEKLTIGIANGGTLARKIVNETRPNAIIAVACHRDLTDGVRESWKYPVYALLNERPHGPCFDTKVDIRKVNSILEVIHATT